MHFLIKYNQSKTVGYMTNMLKSRFSSFMEGEFQIIPSFDSFDVDIKYVIPIPLDTWKISTRSIIQNIN